MRIKWSGKRTDGQQKKNDRQSGKQAGGEKEWEKTGILQLVFNVNMIRLFNFNFNSSETLFTNYTKHSQKMTDFVLFSFIK